VTSAPRCTAWGATVGIIDADVYGPMPLMLAPRAARDVHNRIIPVEATAKGCRSACSSHKEPLFWRGPMIHSFIQHDCAT